MNETLLDPKEKSFIGDPLRGPVEQFRMPTAIYRTNRSGTWLSIR
jgi:hypothetical protein